MLSNTSRDTKHERETRLTTYLRRPATGRSCNEWRHLRSKVGTERPKGGHALCPQSFDLPDHSPSLRIASPPFNARAECPNSPLVRHTNGDHLGAQKWPEECLTSTDDEGGGFDPIRLGETSDDRRFVPTRKPGWLARDCGYVLENIGSHLTNSLFQGTEKIVTSPSRSYLHADQGNLKQNR